MEESLISNFLIDSLTAERRLEMLSLCKEVALPANMVLLEAEKPPRYGYFLTSGFASHTVQVANGSMVDVALLGRESVMGALALLGPSTPPTSCLMRTAGRGQQIHFADLKRFFHSSEEIRSKLLESAQVQAMTSNQIAACNVLHSAQARLARLLLMVYDRVNDPFLTMTQECMAEMLGLRRTTVACAAGALQRLGTIRYARGRLQLLSIPSLERTACDCYFVTRRLLAGLYRNS